MTMSSSRDVTSSDDDDGAYRPKPHISHGESTIDANRPQQFLNLQKHTVYLVAGYGVLEQIYPGRVSDFYDELRIMERLADIFLECIGVRGTLRMGPTGFRNFTRYDSTR